MSAQSLRYNCTALIGTNKKGILKPDANGYYTITVGGFNVKNQGGRNWPLGEAATLFATGSSLRRRLDDGVVYAEYGHPYRDGMDDIAFYRRLNEIREQSKCGHFRSLTLDYNNYKSKEGYPIVAVVADVKPTGPYGKDLKDSLDNPDEETCFSIRAAVTDVGNDRYVTDIVTYDYVNEGGVKIARKYYSMALESMSNMAVELNPNDLVVTPDMLNMACSEASNRMGLESADTARLLELRERLGWKKNNNILVPTWL